MALQEVNSNDARILELADRLDQVQRNAQDSPLYQLPPFPTDDRVPLAQAVEVVSSQAISGATKVVLRWIRPADPNVDHFEIWVQRTAFQSENPYQIASVADAPAAFTINSDQDTAAVMYIRTIMKNGLSTDLQASPTVAVNVYKFVATADDIADGAVQNNHFDRVTANKIVIVEADIANLAVTNAKIANATITFAKISTLAVGGSGLGAPGQFYVYDASNNVVAWAGTLGGYYGMWAKNMWVGGTSPINAPFYVDSSGNVVIDNTGTGVTATFKLVANNLTTTINNELLSGAAYSIRGVDTSLFEFRIRPSNAVWFYNSNTAIRLTATSTQTSFLLDDPASGSTRIALDFNVSAASQSTLRLFYSSGAMAMLLRDALLTIYAIDGTTVRINLSISGSSGQIGLVGANSALIINSNQVVTSRQTGWSAATGTATRTTFATTTVTTAQLAERVKALIDDLITHGLIGT